jgi:hypothetical protein
MSAHYPSFVAGNGNGQRVDILEMRVHCACLCFAQEHCSVGSDHPSLGSINGSHAN